MPIYFYRWHTQQHLKKQRSDLYSEHAVLLAVMASNNPARDNPELHDRLRACRIKIEQVESAFLLHKALYAGIDYPTKEEKPDWWVLEADESWLSEKGQIHVNKLLKEERRKTIDWWLKGVAPVITLLISLLGLVVALVTVLKK